MAETTLINGIAYSWSDVRFNILGIEVSGVDELNYSDSQEITDNYGAGRLPVSRSYGQITYEGNIVLHMEEVVALQNASPTGRLQDLPEFSLPVSFVPESGLIVTDVLQSIKFMTNQRGLSKGDSMFPVDCPIRIGFIKWHKNV